MTKHRRVVGLKDERRLLPQPDVWQVVCGRCLKHFIAPQFQNIEGKILFNPKKLFVHICKRLTYFFQSLEMNNQWTRKKGVAKTKLVLLK